MDQPPLTERLLNLLGFGLLLGGLLMLGLTYLFLVLGIEGPVLLELPRVGQFVGLGILLFTLSLPIVLRKGPLFDASIGIMMSALSIAAINLLLGWLPEPSATNGAENRGPDQSHTSAELRETVTVTQNGQLRPDLDTSTIPDIDLGYFRLPNAETTIQVEQKIGDEWVLVHEEQGTSDQFGRRTVPIEGLDTRPKYALFFGGSFTAGFGINDDDLLPYFLSLNAPDYASYNYGAGGYGTQNVLAHLQHTDIRGQVPQAEGVAVYIYIPNHVPRVIGNSSIRWRNALPYYRFDNDRNVVRDGSLTSGRPLFTMGQALITESNLGKRFNISIPRQLSDEHYELTAAIILESKRLYQADFGEDAPFYVLIYPTQGDERLLPFLEAAEIDVLNYADFLDIDQDGFFLSDGHPDAPAHEAVALRLIEDLNLNSE